MGKPADLEIARREQKTFVEDTLLHMMRAPSKGDAAR